MRALFNIHSFLRNTIHFVRHYIPSVTVLTVLFLLGSLLVPNNKILFIVSALYLALQYFATRSFILALLYSFVPISLMAVGQTYVFQAVPSPQEVLGNPDYEQGRQLFFVFSPAFLYAITCLFGVIAMSFKKTWQWHTSAPIVLLIIVSGLSVISSMKSEFFPGLSLAYSLGELGIIAWLWMVSSYFKSQSKSDQKKITTLLYEQIIAVGIFHSTLVLAQYFSRSQLGLVIEKTQELSVFGLGSDESFLQFRPAGLLEHANILANHLLGLFITAFMLEKFIAAKEVWLRKLTSVFYTLVFAALVITLSRAAYLGLLVFFIGFYHIFKNEFLKAARFILLQLKKYRLFVYLFLFFLYFLVASRGILSLYSFDTFGGFGVRSELVELSFSLIEKHWWLGVGNGMFIPAGFNFNPGGVMAYFPESVHNGFLLFFTERGFLGVVLMGLFSYFLVRKITTSAFSPEKKKLLLLGFVPLLIMMLFHPIFNFMSLYTFAVLLIL